MNICILAPIYHPYIHGGLESYVVELVQRLREHGHRVTIITRGEEDARLPDEGHGEIIRIKRHTFRSFLEVNRRLPQWLAIHLTEMFSGYAARVAARHIRELKPDVIFSQSFYGFSRNMPQTLARCGIPWLHYVHSYDLVCKRQTALDRRGCVCAGQCADCQVICRFKYGAQPLEKAVAIYNSSHMQVFFKAAGIRARETHIIDPVFSYQAPELTGSYAPARPFRLLYLGRISREKGVHLLCDVVAQSGGEYELEVMGDGPLLPELRERHRAAPIKFHGRVESAARDAILQTGHALVVPSLWNEPFGRVIHEAFLAGLPVIAARTGAMVYLIRHGVDGMIFPWKEGDEPLNSLRGALAEAVPRLSTLREGALETRVRLMEMDNFARIEEILQSAVRGGSPAVPVSTPARAASPVSALS